MSSADEIINEPFAGNFYADPLLLVPGVAGKKNLQRMYDHVAPSIRAYDTNHMIFFEPVTWGMIFDGQIVGSGAHVHARRSRSQPIPADCRGRRAQVVGRRGAIVPTHSQ